MPKVVSRVVLQHGEVCGISAGNTRSVWVVFEYGLGLKKARLSAVKTEMGQMLAEAVSGLIGSMLSE